MFTTHEATMVARLKAKLGDTVYVGVLDELERVPEMRQRAPAVWVVYDGYIPIARQDNVPAVVALRMSWWVVAVAKRRAARAADAPPNSPTSRSRS